MHTTDPEHRESAGREYRRDPPRCGTRTTPLLRNPSALVSGIVGQIVRCARKLTTIIDRLDPHD